MDYSPLAPLPILVGGNAGTDPATFFGNLVPLIIAVAGALAVLRIMYGGVIYITTDAWGGKEDAKKIIRNALFGLLLAIGSYAILFTISPSLVRINLAPTPQNAGGEALDPDDVINNFGNRSPYDTGCINNCGTVAGPDLPSKPPGEACSNHLCYLNIELMAKLREVNAAMVGVGWQITEAYPPTYPHVDSCHKPGANAGRCADVALTGIDTSSLSSASAINQFIKALRDQGLSVSYEVTTPARFNQIRGIGGVDTQYRNLIKLNQEASGEHAHVEL